MSSSSPVRVRMIPVDRVSVLNPRERNPKIFHEIVESISLVGLKKPVTVSETTDEVGMPSFVLICGQGRLEAYKKLEQSEIPAIVIDGTEEDWLIMSLAENLARNRPHPVKLLQSIQDLSDKGYSVREIAGKTALSVQYVRGVLKLLERGEERLIKGVEIGQLPLSVAVTIAEADEEGVQKALAEAYERGELRGRRLLKAKNLINARSRKGKRLNDQKTKKGGKSVTAETILEVYQKEAHEQKLTLKRAEITKARLSFIVQALKSLYEDENFVTLLRAEGLTTMPRTLAALVTEGDSSDGR